MAAAATASVPVKIGIIGGTGLDDPDILEGRTEKYVDTPYGKPSDALILGKIKNVDCVLLARHLLLYLKRLWKQDLQMNVWKFHTGVTGWLGPPYYWIECKNWPHLGRMARAGADNRVYQQAKSRHGRHHTIMPSNVNYRANIWALKEENCSHVLVTTACGSLREEIQPGDLVIIDQFIDRISHSQNCQKILCYCDKTKMKEQKPPYCRIRSVAVAAGQLKDTVLYMMDSIPLSQEYVIFQWLSHFAPKPERMQRQYAPLHPDSQVLIETAKKLGLQCHSKGTMITIEGPRFSSRAESCVFRSWGADVINMTTVPEVILAKEAGMSYASIAMATDYDCWKEHEEAVSVDKVLKTLKGNANKATSILLTAIPQIGSMEWTNTLHTLKLMVLDVQGHAGAFGEMDQSQEIRI
ncbi:hypothetical protein DUI87_00722 [Hirundo rustica rustica]|uniref:S-methyl-5'-thioadenosine phosphorylase n=1 Tax=Hirundo rustica rustica TaxID=333673 RepID=A0A3M0LAH5_HIRRU|nr:hypothetical protein DUI87_00722 [Hirundo rustica rustica]